MQYEWLSGQRTHLLRQSEFDSFRCVNHFLIFYATNKYEKKSDLRHEAGQCPLCWYSGQRGPFSIG